MILKDFKQISGYCTKLRILSKIQDFGIVSGFGPCLGLLPKDKFPIEFKYFDQHRGFLTKFRN